MAAKAMPVLPGRRLQDRLAGEEVALLLRRLDHRAGDAVLDRAERVLALHLGQDANARVRATARSHRRAACCRSCRARSRRPASAGPFPANPIRLVGILPRRGVPSASNARPRIRRQEIPVTLVAGLRRTLAPDGRGCPTTDLAAVRRRRVLGSLVGAPRVAGGIARRRPAVRRVVLLPPAGSIEPLRIRTRPDLRAARRPARPDDGGRARRRAASRIAADRVSRRVLASLGALGYGLSMACWGLGRRACGSWPRVPSCSDSRPTPCCPPARWPSSTWPATIWSRVLAPGQPRRRGRRPPRAVAAGRGRGLRLVVAGAVPRSRAVGLRRLRRGAGRCSPSRARSDRDRRSPSGDGVGLPPRSPSVAAGAGRRSSSTALDEPFLGFAIAYLEVERGQSHGVAVLVGGSALVGGVASAALARASDRRRARAPAGPPPPEWSARSRRPSRWPGRPGDHRGARHPAPGRLRPGQRRGQRRLLDHGAGPHPRPPPGTAGYDGGGRRLPVHARRAVPAARGRAPRTGSGSRAALGGLLVVAVLSPSRRLPIATPVARRGVPECCRT